MSESVVKGWDVNQAAPTFTQALTANGGKVDGVLAANDDIANAVIGVLKSNGLAGHVVITGQDAGVEGLQNIINGEQSMTVFKDVKHEANAASQLAIALIEGKDPGVGRTHPDATSPTRRTPSHKIQALLLPAQVITQANVDDVIKAGALTRRRRSARGSRPLAPSWDLVADRAKHRPARWPGDHCPPAAGRLVPGAAAQPGFRDLPASERSEVAVADPILEIKGLNKSFGPVHVLHDIDFAVYPGEVTALVGDNGAGKSTLVKCIAGINSIDSGVVTSRASRSRLHDPRAAAALGIEFVYQDLALADNLDITQNMFLGREISRFGFLADGEMERKARETLTSLSVRTVSSVRQRRLRACPVASARRWPSPRRCCGTARWSSSTSRRPPSVWPRPVRCSTWSGAGRSGPRASCSSRTT